MKRSSASLIMLLLLAGCAAGGTDPEPTDLVEQANQTWIQNRQIYYRNNGWSNADAAFQAQRDFEGGKALPEERPPLERRSRP